MGKSIGILLAVLLGMRGAWYLYLAYRWTRTQDQAWGSMSKRGHNG